jgi:arginase
MVRGGRLQEVPQRGRQPCTGPLVASNGWAKTVSVRFLTFGVVTPITTLPVDLVRLPGWTSLASGRGELLLTRWPEIGRPLVEDADVGQVGEREAAEPDFNKFYGDIVHTDITRLNIQGVLAKGIDSTVRQVLARLESRALGRVWLHVDFDVLDQTVMPAVDSPGGPGLNYQQLALLIGDLCHSGRVVGADFTIYDPERDPHAEYSKPLVDCIARGIRNCRSAGGPTL